MRIFHSIKDWRDEKRNLNQQGESLGFVPTMGALHPGHLSLVQNSQRENDRTLVSIFVNPTQFNEPKDFETYPSTWESDVETLNAQKVDYLLAPDFEEIYPGGYQYKVCETEISQTLCGAHRPGHFDGVLTVVLKLLNIAGAQRAYFGEKDYQQFLLVKGMKEAFFLATEIISCPTLREKDGLAMSSRNLKLTAQQREQAALLNKILSTSSSSLSAQQALVEKGFHVDYVVDKWGRRLAAVRLGEVRLIDNVLL